MSHGKQKKAAVINDFSGFGRCSLTVAIPIISAMGIQCCSVPTSVFTNHTGYPVYYWTDFTDHMEEFTSKWQQLDLSFDAIATGFLGSVHQIKIVQEFIRTFKKDGTTVVVDPVMGDNGELYSTYSPDLAEAMIELAAYADILTPNLTEACTLTGLPYREDLSVDELTRICEILAARGPDRIVISGLETGNGTVSNFVYQKGQEPVLLTGEKVGPGRAGTGDVFSSIITGCAVQGIPFLDSVRKASGFITEAIRHTMALEVPPTDGICFEECLNLLFPQRNESNL